jgi:Fe-S-cluster containining protein
MKARVHLPLAEREQGYRTVYAAIDRQMDERRREAEKTTGLLSPCRAGCATCCYYPVSIEIGDAIMMLLAVRALSAGAKRSIRERARRWVSKMERAGIDPRRSFGDSEEASRYYRAQIPCPLLERGRCVIYAARPSVCRMHMVVGSAEACADPRAASAEMVPTDGLVEALRDQVMHFEEQRIPMVLRLGLWLLLGWRLVEDKGEPDIDAWQDEMFAGASVRPLSSPIERASDPGRSS